MSEEQLRAFVNEVQRLNERCGGVVPRHEFESRVAEALWWHKDRLQRAVAELHEACVVVVVRVPRPDEAGQAADEYIVTNPQVLSDMMARVITPFSPVVDHEAHRACCMPKYVS